MADRGRGHRGGADPAQDEPGRRAAHVLGAERVDTALAVAAQAGRFDDGDLVSILDHLTDANTATSNVVAINETHSAQPGTGPWRRLGA